MGMNLLVWAWSSKFDTPAKRKKHKLKFAHITEAFAESGDHPSIGDMDISLYLDKVFEHFGPESPDLPFVVERYERCVVFSYSERVRFDIVSTLGRLAMSMGLNASEF